MIERLGPRARPLYHLVVARALEFLREPDAVFWVYVFPLFLVVALGIAFRNRPVEIFHVAVARGGAAETVAAALKADERFQAEVCDEEVCRQRLRTGRVDLVIIAAPVGETSGGAPQYEFLFDPTRPENLLARNAADDFLQRRAGRADVVITSDHPQTDPGGRYIDFLIPGLVGMGLMGGGLWGVGFAIVDMRIRKLLKRYLATPVRRSDFMASLILSRLIFTVPEVALVVVFAHVVFGVTVSGSYLLVGLLILLGSLQFSGLGLLVAARAQTIETVMGLMNAVMLPMWIGSGIFFSIERFPAALQPLLYALPLTPLIHALRLVMLEGAGLTAIAPHLLVIAAWAVVSFALALRWFRWT